MTVFGCFKGENATNRAPEAMGREPLAPQLGQRPLARGSICLRLCCDIIDVESDCKPAVRCSGAVVEGEMLNSERERASDARRPVS